MTTAKMIAAQIGPERQIEKIERGGLAEDRVVESRRRRCSARLPAKRSTVQLSMLASADEERKRQQHERSKAANKADNR